MNSTTSLFIRAIQPKTTHNDLPIHIMFITIILSLTVYALLSMGAEHEHRDCALQITKGLSPNQGRILLRGKPSYNRAVKWCSKNPDFTQQIENAKRWPTFPTR